MARYTKKYLKQVYEYSCEHKDLVMASQFCGCFYCCQQFPPSNIRGWVDHGQTALCPICGIDSVLPDAVINDEISFHLTDELLKAMSDCYFVIPLKGEKDDQL